MVLADTFCHKNKLLYYYSLVLSDFVNFYRSICNFKWLLLLAYKYFVYEFYIINTKNIELYSRLA